MLSNILLSYTIFSYSSSWSLFIKLRLLKSFWPFRLPERWLMLALLWLYELALLIELVPRLLSDTDPLVAEFFR